MANLEIFPKTALVISSDDMNGFNAVDKSLKRAHQLSNRYGKGFVPHYFSVPGQGRTDLEDLMRHHSGEVLDLPVALHLDWFDGESGQHDKHNLFGRNGAGARWFNLIEQSKLIYPHLGEALNHLSLVFFRLAEPYMLDYANRQLDNLIKYVGNPVMVSYHLGLHNNPEGAYSIYHKFVNDIGLVHRHNQGFSIRPHSHISTQVVVDELNNRIIKPEDVIHTVNHLLENNYKRFGELVLHFGQWYGYSQYISLLDSEVVEELLKRFNIITPDEV